MVSRKYSHIVRQQNLADDLGVSRARNESVIIERSVERRVLGDAVLDLRLARVHEPDRLSGGQ